MPPLGKMPMNVQDANVDVDLHDVLLDVIVRSKVPIFDVVLLPDDVEVVLVSSISMSDGGLCPLWAECPWMSKMPM